MAIVHELVNNVVYEVALAPVVVADNTAQAGNIIDMQGFQHVTFVALTGTLADVDATFAWTITHGDQSNLGDGAAADTGSLVGTLAGVGFPWLVAAAALVGWAMARQRPMQGNSHGQPDAAPEATTALIDDQTPTPEHARYTTGRLLRTAGTGLALWAFTLGGLALWLGAGHTLVRMGGFFTEAALLTFGGAYAVLPYVTQAAVSQFGWLSATQMMDGLALGETTPGPLIIVVAFVGFLGGHGQALLGDPLLGGITAACVVTWFTFLPSFIFILAGGPLVESSRHVPTLTGPLQAISAAVIGVMLQLAGTFAWHTVWPTGQWTQADWPALALTALAAWLLIARQWPVMRVLAVCVVVGMGVQWV